VAGNDKRPPAPLVKGQAWQRTEDRWQRQRVTSDGGCMPRRSKFRCCARNIADILRWNRGVGVNVARALRNGGCGMTALQGFLLGLTVSWTPSIIFLACIAVQAGAQHARTSEARRSIDRVVALHNP
jgi:hypothetical protein